MVLLLEAALILTERLLKLVRDLVQDEVDAVFKVEVNHSVSFVKHHLVALVQNQNSPLQTVLNSARRAYNHLNAFRYQRTLLLN